MSTQTKTTLIIAGLCILACIFIIKCGNNPNPIDLVTHDTTIKKVFVYDTIKSTIDIPTKVTYYDTIPEKDTSLHVLVFHDTIRLVKHDTLIQEINPAFLTLFPTSPKLILGEFSNNSIALNLLGIDGSVVSKQYNTDYTKFNYEFSGSELKFYPLKKAGNFIQQGLAALTTTAYFETYYNPINNGAIMRLEGNIMYKTFGVSGYMKFSTDEIPKFNTGIGVRVQLK